jgi:hypothetical protein
MHKNKIEVVLTEQQLKKMKKEEEEENENDNRYSSANCRKYSIEELKKIKIKIEQEEKECEQEEQEEDDKNFLPVEYKLTKNEYLVYLFKNLLIGECDVQSLVKYVIQSLPGLTDEERFKILSEGPLLGSFASHKELQHYAYSRLVQYKYSDSYKNFQSDLPVLSKYGSSKEFLNNLYCEEDNINHNIYFSKHPNLK